MVLNEGINCRAISGETGYLVGFGNDDLSVEDVVIGVVAMVDNEWEVNHKAGGAAMAVGAGVGLVGRNAVISQKLRLALTVDNDAAAGAFHIGSDVEPTAHEVQVVILHGVRIDRDGRGQYRAVGVLGVVLAAVHEGQESH